MSTKASFSPSTITGSWFPAGFYGHFRSKPRHDIYSDYRQLAKPQPPRVFISRIKERPTRHIFSHHDNRYSFTTDATYLDQGVGKKRKVVGSRNAICEPNLIKWETNPVPHTDQSVYRTTFTAGSTPTQLAFVRTGFGDSDVEDRRTSAYRHAYCVNFNRLKPTLDAMNHDTLMARPAAESRPDRTQARSAGPMRNSGRQSVAGCLIWDIPEPPVRPVTAYVGGCGNRAPAATDLKDLENGECKVVEGKQMMRSSTAGQSILEAYT